MSHPLAVLLLAVLPAAAQPAAGRNAEGETPEAEQVRLTFASFAADLRVRDQAPPLKAPSLLGSEQASRDYRDSLFNPYFTRFTDKENFSLDKFKAAFATWAKGGKDMAAGEDKLCALAPATLNYFLYFSSRKNDYPHTTAIYGGPPEGWAGNVLGKYTDFFNNAFDAQLKCEVDQGPEGCDLSSRRCKEKVHASVQTFVARLKAKSKPQVSRGEPEVTYRKPDKVTTRDEWGSVNGQGDYSKQR